MIRGLLLLTGGAGTRMGALKHALEHPAGGSWGGHLVRTFESVFPGSPVLVLGDALPERPELTRLDDPREGPAVALRAWAAAAVPPVDLWWVVACDQVRWTQESLRTWATLSDAADPFHTSWVMALHGGRLQPLGGWLPNALRPSIAASSAQALKALAASLPHLTLPSAGAEWVDVDTPEEWETFQGKETPLP